MAVPGRSDPARTWIRKVAPDDDYLPPVEPPPRTGQVSGHLDDDEGVGPEAVAWAEDLARPEQRRSREHGSRLGQRVKVRGRNGRVQQVQATLTKEECRRRLPRPPVCAPIR